MRLLVYALLLAAIIAVIVAVHTKGADPSGFTFTEPPDPPPEPPTQPADATRQLAAELGETRRQLASTQASLKRERRGYRRRLNYVIHAPIYRGHWLERAFLCVHAGEGAWSSNTGNGYHGGLQMDWSFMRSYGPEFVRAWGGAENWPILGADRRRDQGVPRRPGVRTLAENFTSVRAAMSEQLTFDAHASTLARDRSIQQVDEHAELEWKAAAEEAVRAAARELHRFVADDVWKRIPDDVRPHEPRALGPVMLRAQREGVIEPTGDFRLTERVSSHRRPLRVWRLIR